MAQMKTIPARPAPAKPQAAVKAPVKPQSVAAAKAPPPKPAAPQPAKPHVAQASPAAAKSPPAAPESQKAIAEIVAKIELVRKRIVNLEKMTLGEFMTYDEAKGTYVINVANADRITLRNWAYQFGYDESLLSAPTDKLRGALAKDVKAGKQMTAVRDGLAPPEEEEEAAGDEEEQEEEITEEQIQKMNFSQLSELADRVGVDYQDCNNQPRLLRSRLLNALQEASGEEEAETEQAQEEEEVELEEGAAVIVSSEDEQYNATYQGMADDGDVIVVLENGDTVAVPPSAISLPE